MFFFLCLHSAIDIIEYVVDSTISFLWLSGPDPVNTHACNFTQVRSNKTADGQNFK